MVILMMLYQIHGEIENMESRILKLKKWGLGIFLYWHIVLLKSIFQEVIIKKIILISKIYIF